MEDIVSEFFIFPERNTMLTKTCLCSKTWSPVIVIWNKSFKTKACQKYVCIPESFHSFTGVTQDGPNHTCLCIIPL